MIIDKIECIRECDWEKIITKLLTWEGVELEIATREQKILKWKFWKPIKQRKKRAKNKRLIHFYGTWNKFSTFDLSSHISILKCANEVSSDIKFQNKNSKFFKLNIRIKTVIRIFCIFIFRTHSQLMELNEKYSNFLCPRFIYRFYILITKQTTI